MGKIMKKYHLILLVSVILFITDCASTLDVEYPVFPNTKDGRALQQFIGSRKVVGVVVEAPQKGLWSQIFEDSSFIDQMPAKIFESMDMEGYYKLIDVKKTGAMMNEIAFSLTGLTKNRLALGKQLAADMFLYVGYQKPAYVCGTENKMDKAAAAVAAMQAVSNANNSSTPEIMRPTGYIDLIIPLEATLVITETGALKKSVISEPYRLHNSVGNTACPSPLQAYGKALDFASKKIMERLSPKVKTARIQIVVKDEDPDVADLLKEGYEEMKGETPSMQRAYENWQKADRKAGGKSEGALGNIGAYYFSIGDFDNSIKYFEKATALKGKNKDYYRDLRKKVEAAQRTGESKE